MLVDQRFCPRIVEGELRYNCVGKELVGIIHKKGHDLSTVRFLNDLHEPAKAKILERRIAGEKIDDKGEWLPGFDPADQLPE